MVTIEEVWELFESQICRCALTGLPILFKGIKLDATLTSLDRMDSSKEYVAGNLQWTHKKLNSMKWAYGTNDFGSFCKLVVEKKLMEL